MSQTIAYRGLAHGMVKCLSDASFRISVEAWGHLPGSVCLIKVGSKLYRKIEHLRARLKISRGFTAFSDTGFIV